MRLRAARELKISVQDMTHRQALGHKRNAVQEANSLKANVFDQIARGEMRFISATSVHGKKRNALVWATLLVSRERLIASIDAPVEHLWLDRHVERLMSRIARDMIQRAWTIFRNARVKKAPRRAGNEENTVMTGLMTLQRERAELTLVPKREACSRISTRELIQAAKKAATEWVKRVFAHLRRTGHPSRTWEPRVKIGKAHGRWFTLN